MGRGERVACWIGAILTGVAACLMLDPPALHSSRERRRRAGEEASAEELAERLKRAWADRHTP